MLFQDITILDDRFERRDHMYVGVSDGTIDYIGDTIPQKDYGQVYEGKGKLLNLVVQKALMMVTKIQILIKR